MHIKSGTHAFFPTGRVSLGFVLIYVHTNFRAISWKWSLWNSACLFHDWNVWYLIFAQFCSFSSNNIYIMHFAELCDVFLSSVGSVIVIAKKQVFLHFFHMTMVHLNSHDSRDGVRWSIFRYFDSSRGKYMVPCIQRNRNRNSVIACVLPICI